jgi:hypothetical protein
VTAGCNNCTEPDTASSSVDFPKFEDLNSRNAALLVCLQERASWRVRVVGLSMGGEGPEELAPTISNLLAYDGEHCHL